MVSLGPTVTTLTMITTLGGELVQTERRHIPLSAQRRLSEAVGIEAYGDRV